MGKGFDRLGDNNNRGEEVEALASKRKAVDEAKEASKVAK